MEGCLEYAHYDTRFIEVDAELDGMLGIAIGHTLRFFHLSSEAVSIPVLNYRIEHNC